MTYFPLLLEPFNTSQPLDSLLGTDHKTSTKKKRTQSTAGGVQLQQRYIKLCIVFTTIHKYVVFQYDTIASVWKLLCITGHFTWVHQSPPQYHILPKTSFSTEMEATERKTRLHLLIIKLYYCRAYKFKIYGNQKSVYFR